MQAITTKYLSATNTKGSRIKASCPAGSLTMGYPHEFNADEAHAHVAMALIQKLGWTGTAYGQWFQGGIETGFVFVCSGREGIGNGSHAVNQIK